MELGCVWAGNRGRGEPGGVEWADVALGLREPGGEVTASAATLPECPVKGCRGGGGPPRGPPVLAAGRTPGEWRAQAW